MRFLSAITDFSSSPQRRLEFLDSRGEALGSLHVSGSVKKQTPLALESFGSLRLFLLQSGTQLRPSTFITLSLCSGVLMALITLSALSASFIPLFFALGAAIPFGLAERACERRAISFAEEYPTVLLATASSLKTGMMPTQALERSIKLLPQKSLVRWEITKLVQDLGRGIPQSEAVASFGYNIRQPDLELFRTAFLLALDNGGRFAPTLERLAAVSRDRSILIQHARVSTATMRMTANILLVVAPILLLIIAVRTTDFWTLLLHDETANSIASAGVFLIGTSYGILRKMSKFRP